MGVPLLMLAEKEENAEIREFFDLSRGISYTMNFPELVGKCCHGVGFPGWLFTADEHGHMNLFHLFTRTIINLPDMCMLKGFDLDEGLGCDLIIYVEKALLSSDPLSTDDYVLALIQGSPATFAFWRPGSNSFTSLDTIPQCAYSDITWHDSHFYGVNFKGDILIFDFTSHSYPTTATLVRGIPPNLVGSCQVYIVYSMGQLLLITRDGAYNDEEGDDTYGAKTFRVYKIDITDTSFHEVKDLGNRALFVGNSATLAIQEPLPPCIHASHIYFTDDCKDSYYNLQRGGGKDMGVYNLLDGTIVPHYTGQSYHKVTPPLWL